MARYNQWPTPTENDSRGGRNKTARRKNRKSKHHDGMTLVDAVTMDPTPNATDGSKAPKFFAGGNPSLPYMVEMMEGLRDSKGTKQFPTPRADSRDNCGGSNSRKHAKETGVYIGRTLNPEFVEWLMGFPPGWTDLDASATQSCPK